MARYITAMVYFKLKSFVRGRSESDRDCIGSWCWGRKRQVIVHGCAWLEVTCAINLWAPRSPRASRNFHSAFKTWDKTESSAWHQQTLKEMLYASRGNKTSDRDEIKYEEVGMWNIPTSEEFNLWYNLWSEMTNHQDCKTYIYTTECTISGRN